jgi:hypothetical protein
MKNPDRETVSRLDELPNIGKAMETHNAAKFTVVHQYISIRENRDLMGGSIDAKSCS